MAKLENKSVNLCVTPKKILVVFLSGLGNVLLFRPTLKAIRQGFPHAQIDFLIEYDIVEALLKPDNLADLFFRWPGKILERWQLVIKLRKENYDCLVTTFEEQGRKLALFGMLSGIPMRIGYKQGKWYDSFYTRTIDFNPASHEVERHLKLLGPLELQQPEAPDLSLDINSDFSHLLLFLPKEKVSVCIHAGCSRNLIQKRWPLERFISVAHELNKKLDANIIFLGGADELDMVPEIEKSFGSGAHVLIGKLSIWETAFVIKKCALMISNDSGLMHLACAVSTPVIAIFGPTELAKNRPFSPQSTVITYDVACRPCNITQIQCLMQCLTGIESEEVVRAALKMLN